MEFLSKPEFWILFALPFTVIFIAMLVQMAQKAKAAHGEIPWKDTQREAYISAVVAAIITVIVTLIVGGPELFVQFWRPLITTIVVLPFGFGLALVAFGVWHAFRR